ncbi:MAG TPA: C40 family peptidase, partial [Candidatus Eisenbacteria bacterium]|nr:C40 family peptidase [Candidatus Eisenbacteria bacterium]
PLFWGGRVIPARRSGRHREVVLPDGRRGWTEALGLATGTRPTTSLPERARELLGVPYLWGGRTPAGLDCSGLSQLLLAEQGYRLPRDAGDQERACRPIGRSRPTEGDLAFFGASRSPAGHVGVMLGPSLYVHARGRVRINSLDPSNDLYDSELSAGFRSVRRPQKPRLTRT